LTDRTEPARAQGGGRFPTTSWSLILGARQGAETERTVLAELFAAYWKPLYFYLRRKGLTVEAAEDTVQGLFTQLLERRFLAVLDPAKGRFRSYLRSSADHYLANAYETAAAQKRGGTVRHVSLDVVLAERELAAATEAPEVAYEREWAIGLMERAVERLRREYEDGRRRGSGMAVLRFFGLGTPTSYAEAAAASGQTVAQFKASLHRARARFREILREEVMATVDDASLVEAELRELRLVLTG
jgi:RNA polymerase sigma-70 factor (ECF subfamily)